MISRRVWDEWIDATERDDIIAHLCSCRQIDDFWNGFEPTSLRPVPQLRGEPSADTMSEAWERWKESRGNASRM